MSDSTLPNHQPQNTPFPAGLLSDVIWNMAIQEVPTSAAARALLMYNKLLGDPLPPQKTIDLVAQALFDLVREEEQP